MERTNSRFFAGLRVTGLGILASRVLGLLRDVATASLFGLTGGGVMDAFVIAFRIPNLSRRLFGEGAFAASYIPVLTARLDSDRDAAWRLVSVASTWLAGVTVGLCLAGELLLGTIWFLSEPAPQLQLLLGLTAAMLPYMVLVCLAAQLAATLQAAGNFSTPAAVPALLNICWLVAVWGVAPWISAEPEVQAYVIAVAVVVAGFLKVGIQLPPLRALGYRYCYDWPAARRDCLAIGQSMLPMMFGLAVTQINTLADALIAWGLAAPHRGAVLEWAGGIRCPLEQGAAAAVYFSERIFQFPLGVVGIAVATVIFPSLSRHAAQSNRAALAADLTLGLRLVLWLSLPAAAGMVLLAEPIAQLLFQRGEFTPRDAARTATMIACYAGGAWAYAALPVLVRGFYAVGDYRTPVRIGLATVIVNLALGLALLWPFGEVALALSTTLAAALQTGFLIVAFARSGRPLDYRSLRSSAVRHLGATLLMAAGCWLLSSAFPPGPSFASRLLAVLVPVAVSVVIYLAACHWLRSPELQLLLGRPHPEE